MSISSIEKVLTDHHKVLTERVEGIEQDFKSGRNADSEEQAVEMENEEVLSELLREAEEELAQVSHALQRLETGHYGTCSECGKEINSARLSAVPYTTKCISCAIDIEEL